jgi:hypothetical protein
MNVAVRRGLVTQAGGPLCEPAAGGIDAYLDELIEHAAGSASTRSSLLP